MSPGGTAEGRLVHVGTGVHEADYAGIDVEGCFALSCGAAGKVVRMAASKGAVGVVIYPSKERALASQHLRVHDSLRPTRAEEVDTLVPAFSISKWCCDQLLATMETREVRLRGHVDAAFTCDHPLRVLEASIPGRDPNGSEVLLVAHLCHPRQSANDNASGSGLLVEVACQMEALRGELPPYSSIRFLWVPEFTGSLAWSVEHSDILKHVLYTVNLDMVGQSPELIGEPLRVYRAPNSIPTFVNACIEPILHRIAGLSRQVAPVMVKGPTASRISLPQGSSRQLHWICDLPAAGSDHLAFMSAPHYIPSYMVAHEDPYWHTSEDTIEKVDPARLKHVGVLAGALAHLPTVAQEEANRLVNWTVRYMRRELGEAQELALDVGELEGQRLCRCALGVAAERLRSLRVFLDGCGGSGPVDWAAAERELRVCEVGLACESDRTAGSSARACPRRLIGGPLSSWFMEGLDAEDISFLEATISAEGRPMTQFLLDLCNGERSLEDMGALLSLDLGRYVSRQEIERGVDLLADAGYVDRG
jgi:hypothetical protein